jgi:hypothetical protein
VAGFDFSGGLIRFWTMTDSPQERPVLPDDLNPEWADKTGRLMTWDADSNFTLTNSATSELWRAISGGQIPHWADRIALGAEYLARAILRWTALLLTGCPIRHEFGLRGWLGEATVVTAAIVVVAFLNSHH